MDDKGKLDIKGLITKIKSEKRLYIKVLSIVFVLSALWIFSQPRYYRCSVQLAPEISEGEMMGGLGSLASSFGFNLGGGALGDAIYPLIYPQVVSSNDFLVSLFDIDVQNQDGDVHTSYFNYIKDHTKASIFIKPYFFVRKLIRDILTTENAGNPNKKGEGVDSFWLTEEEDAVVGILNNNVSCAVDEEYQIVTITVTDQDRLVCAIIADSVRAKLQEYIIDYRTSKSRNDLKYFTSLTEEAKVKYDKACMEFSEYSDSHFRPVLKKTSVELTKLENEMQQAYTTYNALLLQQQTAAAKLQEATPAFTTIQSATVPLKPAGPKRVLFCFGMLVLGFLGTSIYVLRKDIFG